MKETKETKKMKKPMLIMLVSVGLLFGAIAAFKVFKGVMIGRYIAALSQKTVYVSAIKASTSPWQPQLKAVGSVKAVLGVNVTTEAAGMVTSIHFVPGTMVKQNDLLVELDTSADVAKLHSLEATSELNKITYERDRRQYAIRAISKETLDTDEANLKNAAAQVAQQQALINQKIIHAPFSGRLGIRLINPGQYVNPGDSIVMLQTLDPIYVDFYVPQEALATLTTGLLASIKVDTFPAKIFKGLITTINPGVDPNIRNVEVEATVANPDHLLTPGMFAHVAVNTGNAKTEVTLPLTAISFNPYGEAVYIIRAQGQDKEGHPILIAHQTFVTTGDQRGDQIAITKGVKAGDTVVTSGQLKLKNGDQVTINNTIQPLDSPHPTPPDET